MIGLKAGENEIDAELELGAVIRFREGRDRLRGAQEDAVSHPGSHSPYLRVGRCHATAQGATGSAAHRELSHAP
jgi:hypothetical protein